jgi:hypothetical protein
MARTKVFVSYSHRDLKWLERLQVHLKPLEREGLLESWDDTKLTAGSRWREEIRAAVTSARVAVLLISADFIASEFISSEELPGLLRTAQQDGARILPVIVSPSLFEDTDGLKDFQAVNSPRTPLNAMSRARQEKVFLDVAKTIKDSAVVPTQPSSTPTGAVRDGTSEFKRGTAGDRSPDGGPHEEREQPAELEQLDEVRKRTAAPNHDFPTRLQPPEPPDARFESLTKSAGFEIATYEISLAVEPIEMREFPVPEGAGSRIVRCDNVAHLLESLSFASTNRMNAPFTLRYHTKDTGFITFTPSHTNDATAGELASYADHRYDGTFTFTPKAGETYRLRTDIYKGFDRGNRRLARKLFVPAHYRRVTFSLNLSGYIDRRYKVLEPQLYLHHDYRLSASNDPIGVLLRAELSGPKEWQWQLDDVDEGVLNLIWDVSPPE